MLKLYFLIVTGSFFVKNTQIHGFNSQYQMNSNASHSKRKPTKKKQITTKSPSKSSDIRATANRCGNYIPTRISSILDKLSQAHKKVKENCYFCQYSLYNHCFILQRKSRRNNIECLAGWLDGTPQLPDIDLMNNFNHELLLQYANSTSDSGFSSGNENNNSIQKDKKVNEIPNNLQLKAFFENHLSEIENNVFIRNKNNVDDKVNIGDIEDKQNFVVEQEHDKDPKTKKTLEYFGLRCIEDMFTGSDDDEEAGYQSDSTIIYSPNYPTNKDKSIYVISDNESDLEAGYQSDSTIIYSPNYPINKNFYVISDDESDLEVNTNTCNDGKSLRKRHINESDSEGPAYKLKKSGHQQVKRNTASSDSSSTSASTHAAYKNKARDVQTREKRDNEWHQKYTEDIESASKEKIANIASFTTNNSINIPFEDNDNDVLVRDMYLSCSVTSDTDSDSEKNTDINTNSKIKRERNNDSNNECMNVESVNKGNTNIASFTSNDTITLPVDDKDSDIQIIETNVPCIIVSDADSDGVLTVSDSDSDDGWLDKYLRY